MNTTGTETTTTWWCEPTRDPALLNDEELKEADRALIRSTTDDPELYAAICREVCREFTELYAPNPIPDDPDGFGTWDCLMSLNRTDVSAQDGIEGLIDIVRRVCERAMPGDSAARVKAQHVWKLLGLLDSILYLGADTLEDNDGTLRRPDRPEDTATSLAKAALRGDMIAARALADRLCTQSAESEATAE